MTRDYMLAVKSVLRAPNVIERQLAQMLAPVDVGAPRTSKANAERTVRLAHRMLDVLGRLRRLSVQRWRVTCLYRSVAECLVLRELGFPARVLIGARADERTGTIAAHAWVECDGIRAASTRGEEQYEILSGSSAMTAVM